MVSFYGNIKNNSRISFIFDKTYSSRKKMEDACSSDGVYNGRYVLVKYGTDGKRFIPNAAGTSIIEDPAYTASKQEDWLNYAQTFDATVWQKIWNNNVEKYIMVAELNAAPPKFNVIADAPEVDGNAPHVDEYHSTITDYQFHIPQLWKLNNTTNFSYNVAGFNKNKQSVVNTVDIDGNETTATVYWINEKSGATYPVHETYVPYDYVNSINYKDFYVLEDGSYRKVRDDEAYDATKTYYRYAVEQAVYDEDGDLVTAEQDDRKRLIVDLPAIGNMMSSIWDLFYPADTNGNRDTTIENRDGSVSIPDDTIAEVINDLLYLIGLDTDNEFQNMLNTYPRTIWGLFNAFSQLLGESDDEVSLDNFIPVSDNGYNTTGTTSETNFNNWHNNCFGPLYYKTDNNIYTKAIEYDATEQYYRDINSLWALLREYQELRDNYNPNWLEDFPNSPAYIKNKPYVIVADENAISGIDSNNYYWYIYAGENDGRLTSAEYEAQKNSLYMFDTDTSKFIAATYYNADLRYYLNRNTITTPTKASIEQRWNNIEAVLPNGNMGTIASTSSILTDALGEIDIDTAIAAAT